MFEGPLRPSFRDSPRVEIRDRGSLYHNTSLVCSTSYFSLEKFSPGVPTPSPPVSSLGPLLSLILTLIKDLRLRSTLAPKLFEKNFTNNKSPDRFYLCVYVTCLGPSFTPCRPSVDRRPLDSSPNPSRSPSTSARRTVPAGVSVFVRSCGGGGWSSRVCPYVRTCVPQGSWTSWNDRRRRLAPKSLRL